MARQKTVLPAAETDQRVAFVMQRAHQRRFAIVAISRRSKSRSVQRADSVQFAGKRRPNVHALS